MKSTTLTTDQQLLEQVQAGQYEVLSEVYRRYRGEFVVWAGRVYSCSETDAADCFQDAVIVFYKNVRNGRLTELTSSLKTYLFAIGKRLVSGQRRRQKREMTTDYDEWPLPGEVDISLYDRIEDDHRRTTVESALERLGDPCRTILRLFYYHQYPIESIQSSLGMASPGAVRIKKMRCLEKLRSLIDPSKS